MTTTADSFAYGSLRSAIGWANFSFNYNPENITNPEPNSVVFDTAGVFASPQTITLTLGTLDLSNQVTPEAIVGDGASDLTISGGGKVGVIAIDPTVTATISGVTISGGSTANYGGGIYNDGGTLYLANATVSGNSAYKGGGLDNTTTGQADLTSVTIQATRPRMPGGMLSDGTATVTGSVITGNTASDNGGGHL